MDDQDVLKLVREAMVSIDVPNAATRSSLSLDDSLSDLEIDSVLALELVAYMEEKFGIQFPDDELSGLTDVRGIARLLRRHSSALT
jgi:acyl carrier protein